MNRIPVRENGLVGTFFRTGNSDSAIVVLGGSSGGLHEEKGEKLAARGFSTLSLAYFAAETLPKTLNQIPLEYFEKAFDWLNSQGIKSIKLWGTSRGAELSLILGTLFPERIDAIAAHVPSSVAYGALAEDHRIPAWTYCGQPAIPLAPFILNVSTEGLTPETAISATPSFLKGMEDIDRFEQAGIPVEKIRCPLLLISAEDDQMWPSALFAQKIIIRLAQKKSPIAFTHFSYPRVGHSPCKGTAGLHPIMKRWFAYGGNPKDNAIAAQDWLEKTIAFFNDSSKNLHGKQPCRC